ncbi:MAG: hypothetical protein J2P30_19960, partial [Actinobacteria bacterium]|nr:hypothetical protein [Actinomycetota bacterium]
MSGDLAGAAMGQQGGAGQASGQQDSGQQSTAEQASGGQQGAAEPAAGREGAAEPAAGWKGVEELSRAGWELPWAESPTTGAGPRERAELELAFATAMRRTGSLMQLMGQAAADRIGINSTDL